MCGLLRLGLSWVGAQEAERTSRATSESCLAELMEAARLRLGAARAAAAADEIRRTQAWIDYIAANSKRGRSKGQGGAGASAAGVSALPVAALCGGVAAAEVEQLPQSTVQDEERDHGEVHSAQVHQHALRFTPEHQRSGNVDAPFLPFSMDAPLDDPCAAWRWHEAAMPLRSLPGGSLAPAYPEPTLVFTSAHDESAHRFDLSFEREAELHTLDLHHDDYRPTRQHLDSHSASYVEFPLVALGLGGSARPY